MMQLAFSLSCFLNLGCSSLQEKKNSQSGILPGNKNHTIQICTYCIPDICSPLDFFGQEYSVEVWFVYYEMHIFKECNFISFDKCAQLFIPCLYQDIGHFYHLQKVVLPCKCPSHFRYNYSCDSFRLNSFCLL